MRNRAKCKLCGDILESFHRHDYVECKCKEIAVDGGKDYFRCAAKNWGNFIRLDDEDNEVIPQVIEESPSPKTQVDEPIHKPTKNEMIEMLQCMIDNIDRLPENAKTLPINHYDFISALMLIKELLK